MTSTVFVDKQTTIVAAWLNDVNTGIYNTLPTLAPLISPSFTTPGLGVATATSINKNHFTTPATTCTWALAEGKTLTCNSSLTLAGTDGATLTVGASGGTVSGGGTNTGDQNVFTSLAVSGQTTVTPASTSDTLTLVAGSGTTITTNNGTKSITLTASGITLLATIAPTAATTVDFLSVFTNVYDNYLICIDGVAPASNDTLRFRFSVAGVVDTGSNYFDIPFGSTVNASTTSSTITSGAQLANSSLNATLTVLNANSTTTDKSLVGVGTFKTTAATTYSSALDPCQYVGANAVSGVRFFWNGGANFAATGKIRIYGITNT